MGRSRRTLPEELLLLALDPATGTTAQPQSLDLGLAGAQLVELALAGRIAPDGDRIAVVAPRPTGDPTLDCALELLRRRGTPYDELGLDDPKLSDAELVAAMHEHPILIERPVVRTKKGTRVCRPAERVQDLL